MKLDETTISNMKVEWGLLHSFLHVAREGGLSGAARTTGLSIPSLSRHMTAIETSTKLRLFHRGPEGFALTNEGLRLFENVQAMSDCFERWQVSPDKPQQQDVKISAGNWTALFLANYFSNSWGADDIWRPIILSTLKLQDIARREVDIGVRNRCPEGNWLAGKRVGSVRYGVFQAKGCNPSQFVGIAQSNAPSAQWIERNKTVALRVGDATNALPFVRAGHAKMVLPLFIAAHEADLEICEEIEELRSEQWIVFHQDRRFDSHIRAAINTVTMALEEIDQF